MNQTSLSFALFSVVTACAAAAPAPLAPAPSPAPAAPTGPRMIHKGEQLEAVLHLGETHIYTIELAAAEMVRFMIEGESGRNVDGKGCGNWGWAWHTPADQWMTGNPLGLAPNEDGTGLRPAEPIEVGGRVPESGELVGHGGLWALHVEADGVNCGEIRYRVAAE